MRKISTILITLLLFSMAAFGQEHSVWYYSEGWSSGSCRYAQICLQIICPDYQGGGPGVEVRTPYRRGSYPGNPMYHGFNEVLVTATKQDKTPGQLTLKLDDQNRGHYGLYMGGEDRDKFFELLKTSARDEELITVQAFRHYWHEGDRYRDASEKIRMPSESWRGMAAVCGYPSDVGDYAEGDPVSPHLIINSRDYRTREAWKDYEKSLEE